MVVNSKIFISIIIYLVSYIKAIIDIPIWESRKELENLDKKIEEINSYIFDPVTGAELYLINNKKKLFLVDKQYNVTLENTQGLEDLQPNLIKLNDSSYYFCSSSSKKLIYIYNDSLKEINNHDNIVNSNYNFSIKCLLAIHDGDGLKKDNVIIVSYIGTGYIYYFNPKEGVYFNNFYEFENSQILAICDFFNEPKDTEKHFIALTFDSVLKKHKFCQIKKANYGINHIKTKILEDIELSDKTEISTSKFNDKDRIGYIFSYQPNTNFFTYYIINIENDNKKHVDGKHYLRFFNDFKIKSANIMDNTSLLYYSIQSLEYDKTNYIGVVDLQFFLVVFNIEENPDGMLYFNYGKFFNNSQKLLYFSKDKKIFIVLSSRVLIIVIAFLIIIFILMKLKIKYLKIYKKLNVIAIN